MNKDQIKSEMARAIESFKNDLSSMRTGRSNTAVVEGIVISAYGGAQRLKIMEMASLSTPDPQSIAIDPWDKSVIGEIKQGILAANVGLTPNIDGEIIRISVPPMTGEDRQRHVKTLHAKMENAKISIRQIRGDAMKDIKTAQEKKDISEDEASAKEEETQKLTDDFIKQIENLGKSKEEELLKV